MYSDQMLLAEYWTGGDNQIGIWDGGVEPTAVVPDFGIYYGATSAPRNLGISADRSEFFTLMADGIRRASLADGTTELVTHATVGAEIASFGTASYTGSVVLPDGRVALSGQPGLFVFDPEAGTITDMGYTLPGGPLYVVTSMAASPDGTKLYIAYVRDASIRGLVVLSTADWSQLHALTGAELGTLAGMSFPANCFPQTLAASPDGTLLALAITDNSSQAKSLILRTSDYSAVQAIATPDFYTPYRVVGWSWDSQTLLVRPSGSNSPRWYNRDELDQFTVAGSVLSSGVNQDVRVTTDEQRAVWVTDWSTINGVKLFDLDTGATLRTLAVSGDTAAVSGTSIFVPAVPLLGPSPEPTPFWTHFTRATEIV